MIWTVHTMEGPSQTVDSDREKILKVCCEFFGDDVTELKAIKIEKIAVGRCNRVFRCKLTDKSTKMQKDLLIRLYGTEYSRRDEENREKEVLTSYIASQHEIGPRIIGIFTGGRIEEFIPSYSPTPEQYERPTFFKLLAEKLALIHCLEVPLSKRVDLIGQMNTLYDAFQQNSLLEKQRRKPSGPFAEKLLKVHFENEINFLTPLFQEFPSQVVFSHNDLNRSNILIRSDRNELDVHRKTLIVDFEHSSYNFRWSDFAVVFGEVCFSSFRAGKKFATSQYPSRKKRIYFITQYVRRMNQILGSNGSGQLPEEETVECIEEEVNFGILVAALINIFWRLSHHQIGSENLEKVLWAEAYHWYELYEARKKALVDIGE